MSPGNYPADLYRDEAPVNYGAPEEKSKEEEGARIMRIGKKPAKPFVPRRFSSLSSFDFQERKGSNYHCHQYCHEIAVSSRAYFWRTLTIANQSG